MVAYHPSRPLGGIVCCRPVSPFFSGGSIVGGEALGCMPHIASTGGNTKGPPGISRGLPRGNVAGGGLYSHGCEAKLSAPSFLARNDARLATILGAAPLCGKRAPRQRQA